MSPSSQREANWIDGIRGIASLMVVTEHLSAYFASDIHSPAHEDNGSEFLQLPVIRVFFVGGAPAVALFFVITAYVNSINTLSKARAGNIHGAFLGLARSAMNRSGRLILPASIATFIGWLMAQLGFFKMSQNVDSDYLRQSYKGPDNSLFSAIWSLLRAETGTWTVAINEYDIVQWPLILFLTGSMLVYTSMLCTMMVKPPVRRFVFGVIYLYGWLSGKSLYLMNIAFGMFLADTELSNEATTHVHFSIPLLLIVLGISSWSFPRENHERKHWSRVMRDMMLYIIPQDAEVSGYYNSIGSCLIVFGLFFMPTARRILSNRFFSFLGQVSFAVYLTHNLLIRSLLVWQVYSPSYFNSTVNPEDGGVVEYKRPGHIHVLCAMGIFYPVLYRLAYAWTLYVDPLCGRIVNKFAAWATEDFGAGGPVEKSSEAPGRDASSRMV